MLTIDLGNSRLKWAQFQSDEITKKGDFSYSDDSFEHCLCNSRLPVDADGVVISNVAGMKKRDILAEHLIKLGYKNAIFAATQEEQCGVINSYQDYSLLGVDRWLAMIAGFSHTEKKRGQAVCIVDCGTALTLDLVDSEGLHLGGVIAPGYKLMQSVLIENTSNIKEIAEAGFNEEIALGKTTPDAVKQGCAQLLVGGISNMLKQLTKQHVDTCCIVTGGDSDWVVDLLEIEVIHEPLLVNKGLFYVSVNR